MSITEDWHGHHVENWTKLFEEMKGKPSLNFLEVGSFEGNSAVWCHQNVLTHPSSTMTCVDLFYPVIPDYEAVGIKVDHLYERFMENIHPYLGKTIIKQGYSNQMLRELPMNHYDFVYIDGSHRADDTLEDTIHAFPLLKTGGYMAFDDYGWLRFAGTIKHPKEGIDAFLSVFREKVEVVHKDYQVIIKKI